MKARLAIKLIALGGGILAIGKLLAGHDILTGLAFVIGFLLVLAKIVAAFRLRRQPSPPSDGTNDSGPSDVPVPLQPGPKPPRALAMEHAFESREA